MSSVSLSNTIKICTGDIKNMELNDADIEDVNMIVGIGVRLRQTTHVGRTRIRMYSSFE
jgi:hypothetical protein